MDKARKKTDKILTNLERRIDAVYRNDPSLLRIQKRYDQYMESVSELVNPIYKEYVRETDQDRKRELKAEYKKQVLSLTRDSKVYRSIVQSFVSIMASVNQKAIELANTEMTEIYALNYNAVADECKKVGIEVND